MYYRGMIHFHGIGWRSDYQPHDMLFQTVLDNQSDREITEGLAKWAESEFKMTASSYRSR